MESGLNEQYINCRLCSSVAKFSFSHSILNKYSVSYYCCNYCKLLQTENPFWLNEAYTENEDISYDTGYIQRNIFYSKIISRIIFYIFNKDASFVDFGGGYGILTRLMRDSGFNFYWYDAYTQNIFSQGFELASWNKEIIKGITALEVVEHLPDFKLILDLFINNNCDFLIFTTKLYGTNVPDPNQWSYYSFEAGQHISFYNLDTLNYLANENKLNLYTNNGQLHMLTTKKIKSIYWKLLTNRTTSRFFKIKMESKTLSDSNLIKNKL